MRFRKVAVLRGPNIWANSPVIEAWVELGPLKDTASNAVPGFNDRLKSWLPSMIEHECSEGHRGGFFLRLDEGTYPAHILEHVTLELQSLAGTPVGYGRARVTSEEGVYRVVFKYREEAVGLACLETARELILAALADRPFDVPAQVQRLRDLAREECPGPSTGALIAAAKGRNIPCRRLGGESLIQLGHGAAQRRISATETDRTGAIASSIARDKALTRQLLGAVGVPVPDGRLVADADDAWDAAEELGLPVVIKPRGTDHGRHAALGLKTREEVVAAYEAAAGDAGRRDRRAAGAGGQLPPAGRRRPGRGGLATRPDARPRRRPLDRRREPTETPGAATTSPRRCGGSIARPRPAPSRPLASSASKWPGSTSSPSTSAGPWRRRGASSWRSTRAPTSGRTWSRPRGRPVRSPRRSSRPSSRPEKTAGSRSWPSPASTARRPPRAWWPTSSAAPGRRSA